MASQHKASSFCTPTFVASAASGFIDGVPGLQDLGDVGGNGGAQVFPLFPCILGDWPAEVNLFFRVMRSSHRATGMRSKDSRFFVARMRWPWHHSVMSVQQILEEL